MVNAAGSGSLVIKNTADRKYRTVNCMGEELACGNIQAGIQEIEVPMAGMIFIA